MQVGEADFYIALIIIRYSASYRGPSAIKLIFLSEKGILGM